MTQKQESILIQELSKLDMNELKKLANIWNISKYSGKDKKTMIRYLADCFQDEFYLKGILEKLTPIQVNIFSLILKNKNVQTLGEIVRKVALQAINVEMELNVLRKYFLVYQRKNRERLTNNLDKYHAYEEIAKIVQLDHNTKGEKFKHSLAKEYAKLPVGEISPVWLKLSKQKPKKTDDFLKTITSQQGIEDSLGKLSEMEKEVVIYIFMHGGVIEAEVLRNHININRGKYEVVIPTLLQKYLIFDIYYIDEKFIRVITLPKEIFEYFQKNPLIPSAKKGTRQKQEKINTNELDFFLNIKKMISYISRKGLTLAKSGKIKQADNKRTEQELLQPDIEIFPEKGQVYQIELLLPVLRLLNLVDIKGENIILTGDIEEFQKKDIFEIMNLVVHEVNEFRTKRLNYPEVFSAIEVPFYDKPILSKCVRIILNQESVNLTVIFANVIRDQLILSPGFKIKDFEQDLLDLRREIISAVFYLHLFGLIDVEYPNRNLSLSTLGKHYYQVSELSNITEKGGITINPDFSIIAFPEKCSIYGIHILKAFTELKDYDRVYTFQLNKDSFQQGILLGYNAQIFINFLKESSKVDLAQNLLFLIEDWSSNLPVVEVKEDCVLLQTSDSNVMELLIGQIKGKKIIIEEISPTAILIDKAKIQDVILTSEKLNLIIKLVR
ncbi:MAG: helicase [Spirochaetota bacterium]